MKNLRKRLKYKSSRKKSTGITVFLATIFLMGIIENTNGQQLPRFSQYMMNEFILNPSVAGDDGTTTISAIARKEWFHLGNEMRTPENFCFSAQTRILKSKAQVKNSNGRRRLKKKSNGRVGLGASLYADNSGAMMKTSGQFTYAYHLSMDNKQLSFGLSATMSQINFNTEYLNFYDNNTEPMKTAANSPTWFPDFNAGINYMTEKYHIGASVMQILQSPVKFGNSEIDYNSTKMGFQRNWNVLGAAYLELSSNSDWMVEPSFLLKMSDLFNFKGSYNGPTSQLDLSLRMFYDTKYWFGASYRTVSEFVIMAGMKFNKYYFSYAFDYGFSELTTSSFGSHELSLAIKLGDSARRYNWIDRY